MFFALANTEKRNEEELYTAASLEALEKALIDAGYKVTKTKLSLSASHGGMWSTNGHISNISIVNLGELRKCTKIETSSGWLCKPVSGRLAAIISEAENL